MAPAIAFGSKSSWDGKVAMSVEAVVPRVDLERKLGSHFTYDTGVTLGDGVSGEAADHGL